MEHGLDCRSRDGGVGSGVLNQERSYYDPKDHNMRNEIKRMFGNSEPFKLKASQGVMGNPEFENQEL